MRIAVATPDQYEPLGALTVAAYAELPGMGPLGRYGDELADIGGRGPAAVVLAASDDDDGALLGGVTYYRRYQDAMATLADTLGDLAGFRMLATAPAAQGRGVGAALTLACVERARHEGAPGVALHTTDLMQSAQRLYQRLGFERWAAIDFQIGRTTVFQVLGYRLHF
jgi:GNAT superfamily N-acetyltransferase